MRPEAHRLIPETRVDLSLVETNQAPAAETSGDGRLERESHTRLKRSIADLEADTRLSDVQIGEIQDRRSILLRRIHQIQEEAGPLYAVMRSCEEQVLRARFSADSQNHDSLKIVEEDVRRFARSPKSAPELRAAISVPIEQRTHATIEALRAQIRDRKTPEEARQTAERLWQRLDKANRNVSLAEAALLHAKREFLPYQRRIEEIQKVVDGLDAEHLRVEKRISYTSAELDEHRRLESARVPRTKEIENLENVFHLYFVFGSKKALPRLSSNTPAYEALQASLERFAEDEEQELDFLLANLREECDREGLRIALTSFGSALEQNNN